MMLSSTFSFKLRHLCLCFLLALIAMPGLGHDSPAHEAPWAVCAEQKLGDYCEYENGIRELFRGTCRAIDTHLLCVRNKPIIKSEQAPLKPAIATETSFNPADLGRVEPLAP